MTISSTVRKAGPFDGTGSQTEFPFEFKVFSAGDLYVVQYNEATEVETVLELDSDYTVTLNADQDNDPGGTIELTSALAVNYTLTITSSLANLQPTDLTNRGGFYPSVINDALDRACIQIQQLQDETDRTLKTAVSVPDGVDNTLPMPAANMVIGWDNTGVALKNWSVNDLVTSVAYGSAKADVFTGDGETVDFYLELDPASINNLDVSVGGVCQVPVDDYTWTSGTKVTFTTAPPDGETVLIRYMQALPQGTVVWTSVYGRPFVDDVVYITQDTTITTEVNVIEGGMFIISSGKTLTINGPFSCGLFQCFSGAGSVVFKTGSIDHIIPDWFGLNGDVAPYDTASVQKAFDAIYSDTQWSVPVKFTRDYYVIEVTAKMVLGNVDFCGHRLIGRATDVGTGAVLNDMSVYTTWRNIWIDADYHTAYNCAWHIYSDTHNVAAFLKVYGAQVWNSITGLVYGSYPGQPTFDAPQSENFISGASFIGVERNVYFNQPNGRLWMDKCMFTVQKNNWSGTWNYATSYCIYNEATSGGAIFLNDCDIVNSESYDTTLGYGIKGKNIYTSGVCVWEVFGKNLITGDVTLNQTEDGGDNGINGAYFEIASGATGRLRMINVNFSRPVGSDPAGNGEMVVDSLAAPNFGIELISCKFTNYSWYNNSTVGFRPLVRGGRVKMHDTQYVDLFIPIDKRYSLDPLYQVFASADAIGTSISGTSSRANQAGWTWAGTGAAAGDGFQSSTTNPPSTGSFIQLNSSANPGVASTEIISANFKVQPQRGYAVSFFLKQLTSASNLACKVYFYKWDGTTASSTASATIMSLQASVASYNFSDWIKTLLHFEVPNDAAYARLGLYVDAGQSAGGMGVSDILIS